MTDSKTIKIVIADLEARRHACPFCGEMLVTDDAGRLPPHIGCWGSGAPVRAWGGRAHGVTTDLSTKDGSAINTGAWVQAIGEMVGGGTEE